MDKKTLYLKKMPYRTFIAIVKKWKSLSRVWLSPWNSPGQNTGVHSLSLLQRILPTQGSNPGLLHCRQILYQLSHKGSPCSYEGKAMPDFKTSKDRLTLLLEAASDFKLKPVLIHHFKNPRGLKNYIKFTLPVLYEWNNWVWMISNLFTTWLLNILSVLWSFQDFTEGSN